MPGKKQLYAISFVEGAGVMAAEICGARILSPFFGSSLYVWSAVMAITLGGLASGYFFGGMLSRREQKDLTLFYSLMAATCCICLMPFLAGLFDVFATWLPFLPAMVISVFLLLYPVMFFMGATSPLIISVLTQQASESGANSGRIYAISTSGGIVATFLCGFFFIPGIGVNLTLICFSAALALVSLFLIFKKKSKIIYLVLFIPVAAAFLSFTTIKKSPYTIYQTEGILGKLEIRDEPALADTSHRIRKLLINSIVQTEMNMLNHESVSEYIHLLKKNIPYFPKGKALVLGLGGGLTANLFHNNGYSVTGVEFDDRIIYMAKHYFYLNDSVTTLCEDARHFMNTNNETYQLVLFDLFKAEEQPSYVITTESLQKLKKMLAPNSLVLINTHGYIGANKGQGTQCLLSTLLQSGFQVKVCATGENEDYRNLLIVAGTSALPEALHNELYPLMIFNTGTVNRDEKPVLEKLNAEANQAWRNNYIHNYILRQH